MIYWQCGEWPFYLFPIVPTCPAPPHHTPVTTAPIIWRYLFNIILWILQYQMTTLALLFLGHHPNWCQSWVSIFYQFTLKVSWLISDIMSPSAFSLQQRVRKYDHLISIFTSRAPCCHTLLKMFYVKAHISNWDVINAEMLESITGWNVFSCRFILLTPWLTFFWAKTILCLRWLSDIPTLHQTSQS